MKWKPDEADIIDYLYGELPLEKKDKLERYLKENKSLVKEIEELRQTSGLLPKLVDEEVIPPIPFIGVKADSRANHSTAWRIPLSIAASIALLLVAGYFTQFSMTMGGFSLGFAEEQISPTGLSKAEVERLLDERLTATRIAMNKDINEMKSGFEAQLASNQAITEKQIWQVRKEAGQPTADDEQVLQYIAQLKEENKQMMKNFFKVSADDQKTYVRNILLDYSDYLSKQREEDLRLIQASMIDLKNNSELKQEETEKILANILTAVNTQNPANENKYSLD